MSHGQVMVWVSGLGPGGLDSWYPIVQGIATWGHPKNPKPPTQTTNLPLVDMADPKINRTDNIREFFFWVWVFSLNCRVNNGKNVSPYYSVWHKPKKALCNYPYVFAGDTVTRRTSEPCIFLIRNKKGQVWSMTWNNPIASSMGRLYIFTYIEKKQHKNQASM